MDLQGVETTGNEQLTLLSLEELTVKTNSTTGKLKEDLKTARQMLKDTYTQSESYTAQQLIVEGERGQLKDIKKELDRTPAIANILQTVKDLSAQIKEKTEDVSSYALEYTKLSGKEEIEKNGLVYTIVKSAKLVSRKQ